MKRYIKRVHGFKDENIVVLLDDGKHAVPTYKNIINAYKKVVSQSEEGDAIFLHYSGEFNGHHQICITLCAIKLTSVLTLPCQN